jgi:hypothetical protein
MNLRTLFLAAPLAVVMACGGSTSTGTGSAALDAAVPAFSKLSIDQTVADATAPLATPVAAALAADVASAQMMGPGGVCHPRLFEREREVVERLNRHVYKVLRLVERVIATNPVSSTETSKTWGKTEGGVDVAFTIRLVGPSVYSWDLAAGPTGTTPLPIVLSGEIDRNGYTGAHEGKGTIAIDFAKLHAAFPNEKAATGTLDVRFDVSAVARTIAVRGTGVTWDLDPARFDGNVVPTGLTVPRDGAYLYRREPGKGGSLKIQDEMVFLCAMSPAVTNPTLTPASTELVSRWYHAADGSFHGRTDGKITGGQLAAPTASIVGTVCHSASAEQAVPDHEFFWMMKAEDTTGALVPGLGMMVNASTGTAPACDPAYGPVPVLADASKDFTAWPASYFDDPFFPFLP